MREALRIGATGIGLKEAAPDAAIETTISSSQITHHKQTGATGHE
jgi:ethanolamine ammonia-lyase small subunit